MTAAPLHASRVAVMSVASAADSTDKVYTAITICIILIGCNGNVLSTCAEDAESL